MFDPIMAASLGLPVVLIDYALTICVLLMVVSAVSMVGVILVVGLLITPAVPAYLLSVRHDRIIVSILRNRTGHETTLRPAFE
jgi:manganese/iron transport system permease protein/iron/zinc/copper transport system permease protein